MFNARFLPVNRTKPHKDSLQKDAYTLITQNKTQRKKKKLQKIKKGEVLTLVQDCRLFLVIIRNGRILPTGNSPELFRTLKSWDRG